MMIKRFPISKMCFVTIKAFDKTIEPIRQAHISMATMFWRRYVMTGPWADLLKESGR